MLSHTKNEVDIGTSGVPGTIHPTSTTGTTGTTGNTGTAVPEDQPITGQYKKPSLLDRLNPKKDTTGDGKPDVFS